MNSSGAEAVARIRRRPARAALAALGVLAASAMLGAALAVALGLSTGFDRAAARADLPDVIARFAPESRSRVDARLRALPGVETTAYRFEVLHLPFRGEGRSTDRGAVQVVDPGRRGYAVVEGHDVRGAGPGVVVERGLAREWGLRPGSSLRVSELGSLTVQGIAVAPDNVAFPLAGTARAYVTRALIEQTFGRDRGGPRVNEALLWMRPGARLDIVLSQARATSYGVRGLRFVTRAGVRVLLDQAAGIVIALLVAVSLVALGVAGVMLAASARADVQRSLPTIGLRRALGFGRREIAQLHGAEAALVAAPAAAVGLALGAALASVPATALLQALNELGPGAALIPWLVGAWLVIVGLVTTAATWPAWRAGGAPLVPLLRGAADVRSGGRARGGFLGLGARLALARPARAGASVAVLAASAAFIALMLALGSLLQSLRDDPGTVGKRYQLAVQRPASAAPAVARVPGVLAAAPRLVVDAADSFALGEGLQLIAYAGDHTRFEAPPLAAGRRERGPREAEVGVGLADALGLRLGGSFAVQLASGAEVRFRVVGIVRALGNDGRVAYVGRGPLLAAGASGAEEIAVRLKPGADAGAVRRALSTGGGPRPVRVGGATSSSAPFLGTVAALVWVVAALDAVVCLFALAQALSLTTRERRATVALLRALGAPPHVVGFVFAGSALVLVVPALVLGLALERWVLAPAVARLAAGYAALEVSAGAAQSLLVTTGLVGAGLGAAAWAARRANEQPVVAGLREE